MDYSRRGAERYPDAGSDALRFSSKTRELSELHNGQALIA